MNKIVTLNIQVRGVDERLWEQFKARAKLERLSLRQLLEKAMSTYLDDPYGPLGVR